MSTSDTPARTQFIASLAAGATVEAAAAANGISRRTAYRWLNDPTVGAALEELRRGTLDRAATCMLGLVDAAAATLAEVMADRSAGGAARVAAAGRVLTHALPLYEATELEARLTEVERLLARRPSIGVA